MREESNTLTKHAMSVNRKRALKKRWFWVAR